ncbi:hypothetical protein [Sorangium sp. So ce1389]|uniref:hypothetical protein n=1 Tax=Sorangium sp. So ce1389 TaxID=3133336 RepID=UPI003F60D65E
MTRERLSTLCGTIFFFGLVTLLLGATSWHERPPPSIEQIDDFAIDLGDLTAQLRDKPKKEVDDQLRDWAVYGTLARMGLDRDTLGKATFKTAPVRLPYLEEAYLFDYGRGRRAIVGEKDVLLFYEADDPDPIATLGRLADRVRMETGEIPASFQIFEISPDLSAAEIRVQRKQAVDGSTMFGPAYGYVERTIDGLESFRGWLADIDDVTYVGTSGSLRMGGRRFEKTRTMGVTVEDVAAVAQAHAALRAKRAEQDHKLEPLARDYQRELDTNARKHRNGGAVPTEDEVRARYTRLAEALVLDPTPSDPGFSLDPQWKAASLAGTLETLASDPCALVKEAREIARSAEDVDEDASSLLLWQAKNVLETTELLAERSACAEIVKHHGAAFREMAQAVRAAGERPSAVDMAALPLLRMEKELGQSLASESAEHKRAVLEHLLRQLRRSKEAGAPFEPARAEPELATWRHLLHKLTRFARDKNKIQCARYDGPLQGTRVGMNLFYTDLLAKLWQGVDQHHAAPAAFVPGFLSHPRLRMEPAWEEESKRLSATRLWFGPKPESYAKSTFGDAMWLGHIGTRIFAAGSDPTTPGKEEQPSEESRRTLGWWDRHYADVADYEQQYHVLNQIMKWSILTGWKPYTFSFLEGVPVDRKDRFDRWLDREKANLRYQHPVAFRPESEWATQTECIDLLVSYPFDSFGSISYVYGGVSLAGEGVLRSIPKVSSGSPRALRQAFAAGDDAAAALRARPVYAGPGRASVSLSRASRTRQGAVDLRLGGVETTFEKTAGEMAISLKTNEAKEIGKLSARVPDPRRVKLGWNAGEVEHELAAKAGRQAVPDVLPGQGADPVKRALDAARHDDIAEVVRLAETAASEPQQLRGTLFDLRKRAVEQADDLLAKGDGQGAHRLYDIATHGLGESSPSVQLRAALADISRGHPSNALAKLGPIDRMPQESLVRFLDDIPARGEFDDVRGALTARLNNEPVIFNASAGDLKLVTRGMDLGDAIRLDRPLQGQFIRLEQRAKYVAGADDCVLYIDDTFSLNRHGPEAFGRESLAELAKSRNVSWRLVEESGERYTPSIVELGQTRYERMALDQAGARFRLPRTAPSGRVLLIRRCDEDRDGHITSDERAACEAA